LRSGRGNCGGDDVHQSHTGADLFEHASAAEGRCMIDQRSPILRLLTLLLATVLGLFFALPMLWLITAPFNERATLSVSIPQPPSLANFEVVFNNQFAIRALFVNNLIIGGGVMVLIAIVAT